MYDPKVHNLQYQKSLRQELRKRGTKAENFLWKFLRRNNLGEKFHRQFGLGRYVVDFCSWNKKLIIEIYGEIHNDSDIIEYDKVRENFLKSFGFTILRFKNVEVLKDIGAVVLKIKKHL